MSRIGTVVRCSATAAVLTLAGTLTASWARANPVLLFEPATGHVLYAEEPDRLWHPASVTKLMTAYLTFDAVKVGRLAWDDDVPLSDYARGQPATRIGLRAGIKLNVEQAVRGLILRSANDFAVALAERVGGTEEAFVMAMNDTAKRLGMARTVFRNPHGLPDEAQVTTARDLATLTAALLRDFPDRAEVFATPTVRIHKGTFHSHNDLLRSLDGADGMKTGFTCASGYNVVASATRDGHRLVAIVLGEYTRERRSARATALIEAGFSHLAGDPALRTAVVVPPPAPIKLRHAAAHATASLTGEPHSFMPVTLRTMPVASAEPETANIGRDIRGRTCRGYSGFTRPDAEHDPEDEHEPEATGASAGAGSATPPVATRRAKPSVTTTERQPTRLARPVAHQKANASAARPRTPAARRAVSNGAASRTREPLPQGAASAMHQSPEAPRAAFGQ